MGRFFHDQVRILVLELFWCYRGRSKVIGFSTRVSLLCRVLLVWPFLTRIDSSDSGAYGREISIRLKSRSSSSSRILESTVCIRCISSSISLLIPWHYELDSSSLASQNPVYSLGCQASPSCADYQRLYIPTVTSREQRGWQKLTPKSLVSHIVEFDQLTRQDQYLCTHRRQTLSIS